MAEEGGIRIGKVSKIDYATGMISVVYTDRDASVTALLPSVNFGGKYKMPAIGSMVLVAHLSTGAEGGVVIGNYWNKGNTPGVSGAGVCRDELGSSPGEAYIEYDGSDITFKSPAGTLTLGEIIQKLSQI